MQFHPWVGKIPWRRAWQPTPVFLPTESHGQRSMAGYGPWGCKESDTTEVTECTHMNSQGLASWQKPSRQECIRLLGEIQAQTCSAQTLELCDNILFFFSLSLSLSTPVFQILWSQTAASPSFHPLFTLQHNITFQLPLPSWMQDSLSSQIWHILGCSQGNSSRADLLIR